MKKLHAGILSLSFLMVTPTTLAQSRTIDTLINVGGYALHFVITAGRGTPILFEAGGGDDASAWKDLLKPISQITGAPLVTYDRPGFGKSGLDTINHGIDQSINGLEIALNKLGFGGKMMCVAHSLGGIYTQVLAYRHPNRVKAAVMVDATTACFYQPLRLSATQRNIDRENGKIRYTRPGSYFQGADFSRNMEVARRSSFPANIPVIDLVSDHPPFTDSAAIADWKHCHRAFVATVANRKGITAWGCGHYIFKDNPPLVVLTIAKAYTNVVNKNRRKEINERIVNYAIETVVDHAKDR